MPGHGVFKMKGPLLSLLLLLLQVLSALCQPLTQYTLHDGEPCFQLAAVVDTTRCYTLVSGSSRTWTAAVSACRKTGRKPVVVGDRDTHAALVAVMKNQQLDHVWLPATLDRNSWYWAGTSEIVLGTYSAWRSGHPLSPERSDLKDCVMAITYLGFPWEDKECAFSTGFICQADVGTKLCDDGRSLFDEVIYVDNICLLISNQRLSFFKARDHCAKLNAQLLRVQDEATQNALRHVTSWNTTFTYGYWIGLTRTRWLWENGEEVNVSFWEASQPSMSNADCAVLKKFSEINYFWANWNCEAHLPYICVADIPVETTTEYISSMLTSQTLPSTTITSSSTISAPTTISIITTTTDPSTTPTSSTSTLPSTMTRSTKTGIPSPSTPHPSSEEAPIPTSIPLTTTLTPSSTMQSPTPISPRTTSPTISSTTTSPTTTSSSTSPSTPSTATSPPTPSTTTSPPTPSTTTTSPPTPSTTTSPPTPSTTTTTTTSPPTPSTTTSPPTPSTTRSPPTPSPAPSLTTSSTTPLDTPSLTSSLMTPSTTLSPTTSSTISSQKASSTSPFPTTTSSTTPSATPSTRKIYSTTTSSTTSPYSTVPVSTTQSPTTSSTKIPLLDLTSPVTTNLTSSGGRKSTLPPGTGPTSEVVSAARTDASSSVSPSAATGENLASTLSAMSSTSSTESSTSTTMPALFSTPPPAATSSTGIPPLIIKTETTSNPSPTSVMSSTTSKMTSLHPTKPSTRKAPLNPIPRSTIEYRTVTSSQSTSASTGSMILGTILPSRRSPSSASTSPSVSPPGTEPTADKMATTPIGHSPNEVGDTGEVKQDDNSTVLAVAISLSVLAIICIILCGIVMYHRWKSRDPSQHPARAPSSKSTTSLYRKRSTSSTKSDADFGTSERRQMSRPEAMPNILHPAYYEPDLDPPVEDLVGEADTAAIEAGVNSEDSENMFVLADDTLFTVYDDEIDDFTYIDQFGMDRQLGSAEFVFVGRSNDRQRPSSGSTLSSFTGVKNKKSKRKDKTEAPLSKGTSQSPEIARIDIIKSTAVSKHGRELSSTSLPPPPRPSGNRESGENLPSTSPRPSGNQETGGNLPTSCPPAPRPSGNQEPCGNLPTSCPPAPRPSGNQEPGGNLPTSCPPAPRPSGNQEPGGNLPTSCPPSPQPSGTQEPGGNLPTTSPSKPSGKQEASEGLERLQPLPPVPSLKLASNGPSFKKEPMKEDHPKLRSILKNSNKRASDVENGRRKGWRRSTNRDSRTSEKSDRSSRHSGVSWEDGGLVDERPVSEEVLASTYGLLISNMDKYTHSWAVPYPGDNVPVTEL